MANEPSKAKTQLYLVLDLAACEQPVERMAAILHGKPVPSVLIRPNKARTLQIGDLRALVGALQREDIAVLVADDVSLAKSVRADGVHLSASTSGSALLHAYEEARRALGKDAIIGVDAGSSRHDAMVLGEAGADYVAFGAFDEDRSGTETARESQIELISWWAALFEVPVVALDVDVEASTRRLMEAGADFVVRTIPAGKSTTDLQKWIDEALAALEYQHTSD